MSSLDHAAQLEISAPAQLYGDGQWYAEVISNTWGKPSETAVGDHRAVSEATQISADTHQAFSEIADRLVVSLGELDNFGQFGPEIQMLLAGAKPEDFDGILSELHLNLSKKLLESGSNWKIDKIQYAPEFDQVELSIVNTLCDRGGLIMFPRVAQPKFIDPGADCGSNGLVKVRYSKT